MVTTHDPQIKQWAEQTDHVISARMAFDQVSLMPLYHLELGISGESCAIEIARRLGMDEGLLFRARQVADHGPGAKPETARKPMRIPAGPRGACSAFPRRRKERSNDSPWATA